MIVWIASYPRSGNTFFRMFLHHYFDVNTYSIYNDKLFDNINVSEVIGHKKLPGNIKDLQKSNQIYFVKTHNFPSDLSPAFYIVRDGRDSLVSYAKYLLSYEKNISIKQKIKSILNNTLSFEDTLKKLIIEDKIFGGWKNNVLSWFERERSITKIIKYENLIENPEFVIKDALRYLNINLDFTNLPNFPSFEELNKKWPDFFRKGKVGSWTEEMNDDLHNLFWEYHGPAMNILGYEK